MALLVSTTLASLSADISKVFGDPDRISGFGSGEIPCPCGITGIYMMQAQITTFCRSGNAYSHDWLRLRLYFLRMGVFFAITGALCAYLIVKYHFAVARQKRFAGVMALVNFESVRRTTRAHAAQYMGWLASAW